MFYLRFLAHPQQQEENFKILNWKVALSFSDVSGKAWRTTIKSATKKD